MKYKKEKLLLGVLEMVYPIYAFYNHDYSNLRTAVFKFKVILRFKYSFR
jgi:hypothetical protein